ncbi:MAG TPA: cysteine desulfurase family protein [Flavobacterium sp.]|jgi:cysteine desulfurase|uniref:cysteine desulfurase family protein n=1 Tax=Flavobacterium sp. TaxID=239 RepID=UPI001B6173CD|nr:cysteine desulfurase family protein [Flavobacterium sp.]MBP6146218.1 cysteine desulfurase [Flavobacterium sp.]MBP7181851.1 cysteine desulfurase [Flavobacterium sp.]MBP7317603.1 cysteine desulfurase [Flavobacterium sp.]MBP8885876.1 cysteine desulfurase [Flavobacterium sp.]HRL70979.1 cysteine desulfurase family protein [Flavobacterium sp.]
MKKIYLDNASTTALRPEVIQEMTKVLTEDYGNPSSTHGLGRTAKNILELSRKSIAKNLNATAQEIIFTSCGTEANNWILRSAVKDLQVKRIITSKIEHHAVLYTALVLEKEYDIQIDYVNVKPNGEIDITHLVELLSQEKKTLVSLMHVNNEIGTVLDLERIGRICQEHNTLFHSDTVQSIGKTPIDLEKLSVDFIVASAHKFHGPKGTGFAFIRKNSGLQPLFFGGEQEKGLRAGTEALHQIAGMAKALKLSYSNLETEQKHILELRKYLITQLKTAFPEFKINGNPDGFYTVLNVLLPFEATKTAMLLFHLDMKGIAVSRGSACQSGSIKASHVLAEMLSVEDLKKPSLRISFSHYNTKEDIDILVEALKTI